MPVIHTLGGASEVPAVERALTCARLAVVQLMIDATAKVTEVPGFAEFASRYSDAGY